MTCPQQNISNLSEGICKYRQVTYKNVMYIFALNHLTNVLLMGRTQPYNFSPNLSRNFKFSPVFIWFKEATLLEANETGKTILQAQAKKIIPRT